MNAILESIGEKIQAENPLTIPAVKADEWAKYLKLKSEKSALERQIKTLEESFQLPEAKDIAREISGVIKNGNGDEVGKISFFHYPGANIPAGWRRRIS
jgi:cell division protein FtsB